MKKIPIKGQYMLFVVRHQVFPIDKVEDSFGDGRLTAFCGLPEHGQHIVDVRALSWSATADC